MAKDFFTDGPSFSADGKGFKKPATVSNPTASEVKAAAENLLNELSRKAKEGDKHASYVGQGRDDLDQPVKSARDVLALVSRYLSAGGGGGTSTAAETTFDNTACALSGDPATVQAALEALCTWLETIDPDKSFTIESDEVTYDNTVSGLTATDVKAAIDELDAAIDAFTDTDTHTSVSENGTPVVADVDDINFTGTGVSVADDADGTVTVTITDTPPNPDQNLFETVTADTGSTTANTTTDTLTVAGTGGIATSITGDTLTIDGSAIGGGGGGADGSLPSGTNLFNTGSGTTTVSGMPTGSNNLRICMFKLESDVTVTGAKVFIVGAGADLQFALYEVLGNGAPGTAVAVATTGIADGNGAGAISTGGTFAAPVALTAGWYFAVLFKEGGIPAAQTIGQVEGHTDVREMGLLTADPADMFTATTIASYFASQTVLTAGTYDIGDDLTGENISVIDGWTADDALPVIGLTIS